jgi:hypothetical protein
MAKPKATGEPTFAPKIGMPEVPWKQIEADFERQIQAGLRQLRAAVERFFREEAELELLHSSAKYLKGVTVSVVDDGVEADITGWFPVALEEGAEPFDLKPGFLQGRPYRVIPVGELGAPKFRTVSVKSRKDSWWHPGLQARGIGARVTERAEREIQFIFKPLFDRVKI